MVGTPSFVFQGIHGIGGSGPQRLEDDRRLGQETAAAGRTRDDVIRELTLPAAGLQDEKRKGIGHDEESAAEADA